MNNIRIKKSKWYKQKQCSNCKIPMDKNKLKKNDMVCPNCGHESITPYGSLKNEIVRTVKTQKRYLFIWVTINKRIEHKDQ